MNAENLKRTRHSPEAALGPAALSRLRAQLISRSARTNAISSPGDAIIVTDKSLGIIGWNDAATFLYGWTAEEARAAEGQTSIRDNVLHVLTEERVIQSLISQADWTGETSCYRKDDLRLQLRISISILWDRSGAFNGLVTVHHDSSSMPTKPEAVIEADEVERAVRERTAELINSNQILQEEVSRFRKAALVAHESEGNNRDLVDNIKLGVFRSTPGSRGRFLEVNSAMEEITGYDRGELLAMNVCDLFADTRDKNLFTDEVTLSNWKDTREMVITRKNGALITVAENIMTIRYSSGRVLFFDGILEDVTEQRRAQRQIQESLERLQKTIREIIQVMAYIGQPRDPYTVEHEQRVAELSSKLAPKVGLRDDQSEGLTMAAFVHDIGKYSLPMDILNKPGKLTRPELEVIKDHVRIGYETLKRIEFPWPIATIVLQHHERLDGSGYPAGLKGEQIIPEARILAVADVVVAMSSLRPYRAPLGIEKALAEISVNRGTLYDPVTVDACVKLFTKDGFDWN